MILAPWRNGWLKLRLLAGMTVYCCPPAPVNVIGWLPAWSKLTGVLWAFESVQAMLFALTDCTVILGVEAVDCKAPKNNNYNLYNYYKCFYEYNITWCWRVWWSLAWNLRSNLSHNILLLSNRCNLYLLNLTIWSYNTCYLLGLK